MTVLDKIKGFFKWYAEATLGPKPEAKGAEKKAAEPLETKIAEAPEKKGVKVAPSRKTGLVGGNQGAGVFLLITTSLIRVRTPPVTGALGVIGISGRAR